MLEMTSIIATTLAIGILSPLLAILFGWPLGIALRTPIRGSRALQLALLSPQVLSPIVSAYGWFKGLQVFGLTYGLTAVVVVCALGVIPWVILQVATATPFSKDILDVARTLGARRRAQWWNILLPISRGAMISAGLQGALWCFCTFTIAVTLGGGPAVETLEITIFQKLRSQWDPRGAFVAAGIQLALGVLLTILAARWLKSEAVKTDVERTTRRQWIAGWTVAGIFLTPFVVSLAGWFPPKNFGEALLEASGPLGRSTLCASVVTLIAGAGAVALGRFRFARKFWFLMTGVSPVAVGLLVWLAVGHFWDPFAGALLPVILIQVVIFGGLASRVWEELRRTRPYESFGVARTLGASRFHVFTQLEWPRVRQPFLAALALVFAFSLTDVSVTRVIGSTEEPLFGAYLMSISGQYRIDEALALGSLGSLFGIAALLLGGRFGQGRSG